ncbi:MAG: class I SAM-dependent methyltransferase [Ignavibacteriaceae bacterium]|nr:class I SAM-dependent methyltransferase [Ignavibacteriaceae bacterium]
MHYDPIKDVFAAAIRKMPVLRVLFYKSLDVMFLRSWFVRRELKKLRKFFGTKKLNIFDAGTGYGQYTYFMAKNLQPNEIYAVDVKEKWIKDAESFFKSYGFNNVSFGVEDLTQINHTDKFDLIVCVDVMEHIEDDIKVFQNYFNALKSGGFLLINTPSIFGGSDVHDEGEESFIGEHARDGYSKEDFIAKLEPIGFKVHNSLYSYGFWGDLSWRLGIKYPMMLLNLSKIFFIVLPFYYLITLPFTLLMMRLDYNTDNKIGAGIIFIARKD